MAESQVITREPTDEEIIEWTSDELARQRDRRSELRRLMVSLPEKLIEAAGFHWSMLDWLTDDQRFHFLDSAWRSEALLPLMGAMARDVGEFIFQYCSCYSRPLRDNPWDEGVDRPRDPWVFEPQVTRIAPITITQRYIERRGIRVMLDESARNGQCKGSFLRLEYLDRFCQQEKSDGWSLEVKAEECITPFEDFCYPPDATVTIGFREDGRIDIKVFAKEMPGSPVLHWIFPDPKRDDLDPAYRDFLWWL